MASSFSAVPTSSWVQRAASSSSLGRSERGICRFRRPRIRRHGAVARAGDEARHLDAALSSSLDRARGVDQHGPGEGRDGAGRERKEESVGALGDRRDPHLVAGPGLAIVGRRDLGLGCVGPVPPAAGVPVEDRAAQVVYAGSVDAQHDGVRVEQAVERPEVDLVGESHPRAP